MQYEEYRVLQHSDVDTLQIIVNRHLAEGYVPVGGVSEKHDSSYVTSSNSGQHSVYVTFMQAVAKVKG